MSPDERMLITQLFERLRGASSASRDPDAEAFIRQQIVQQPHAPYAMAQTIVAQTKALEATQERIRQLEASAQEPSYSGRENDRGFAAPSYGARDRSFDDRPMGAPGYGAAGGGAPSPWNTNRSAPQPMQSQPAQQPSPWGQQVPQQQGGGGFLAGAMQTALGVAGGAMLFEGMRGMFGGGSASAAEGGGDKSAASDSAADKDTSADTAADNSDGGDEGGGGWLSDAFGGGGDDGGGDSGGGDW